MRNENNGSNNNNTEISLLLSVQHLNDVCDQLSLTEKHKAKIKGMNRRASVCHVTKIHSIHNYIKHKISSK